MREFRVQAFSDLGFRTKKKNQFWFITTKQTNKCTHGICNKNSFDKYMARQI